MGAKLGIISFFTLLCFILSRTTHYHVWNMFFVWTLIIWIGTLIKYIYRSLCHSEHSLCHSERSEESWLSRAWDIFQTFVFITFTRLFFRSGSNLDPALANEEAWNTAKNMVNQIGGHWDLSLVPTMAAAHWQVLVLFVIGMIIHWLPERFKRRYRIWFAKFPLGVMAIVVALIVFVFCQFITADLQTFIYFQF